MLLAIMDGRIDDVVAAAGESAHLQAGMGKLAETAETVGIALDALQLTGDVSALLPLMDLADTSSTAKRARLLEADLGRLRGVAASLAGNHDQAVGPFRHGALGCPEPRRSAPHRTGARRLRARARPRGTRRGGRAARRRGTGAVRADGRGTRDRTARRRHARRRYGLSRSTLYAGTGRANPLSVKSPDLLGLDVAPRPRRACAG